MISKNKKSVTIIGAGVGGLYSAWKLTKSGFDVTLIEKQNFVGGLSTSIEEMGCNIDIGPHYATFPKNSDITKEVFEIMGKNIIEIPEIKNSYKSFFQGKIINHTPTIYDAMLSFGMKSILKSLISFIFSRIFFHKMNNTENYLIKIYGKYLFQNWCKPYLKKTSGKVDIPLDYAKKKFKPITFAKIFKKIFLKKKSRTKKTIRKEIESEFIQCYFKEGIGQFASILSKKIIESGGKIILGANINKIEHENEIKKMKYTIDGKEVEHSSEFIIYATPLQITKRFFGIDEKIINSNLHSIMVFLLINSPKIFDGWILDIFDAKTIFFRIAQQTFLSKYVAPCDKSLLSIEIRCDDENPLWTQDNKMISKQIEQSIRTMSILKNEKIEDSQVIKLRNIYPKFKNLGQNNNKIEFINNMKNEYILGTKEMDTGRLIEDEQLEENVSLGGIYTAIQESKNICNILDIKV